MSTAFAGPDAAEAQAVSGTVKLTVALPRDAIDTVEAIAAREHKTKTQVLREAIALKAFIDKELAVPETHLLIERGGTTREIVFT